MSDDSHKSGSKNNSHQRKGIDPDNIRTKQDIKSTPSKSNRKSVQFSPEKQQLLQQQFDAKAIMKYEHEIENIQKTIMKELETLREDHDDLMYISSQWRSLVVFNEDGMLGVYKMLGQISGCMASMSKALQAEAYPVELYRSYRMISEGMAKLTMKLQGYRSTSEGFASVRDQLLSQTVKNSQQPPEEQYRVSQSLHTSTDSLEIHMKKIQQQHVYPNEQSNAQRNQLNEEIVRLQTKLRSNNQEFVKQIKKYNTILYQLQSDIEKVEQQLHISEVKYADIENQNSRMREQKVRDDLIINNLTKKLRGGRSSGGGGNTSPRQHRTIQRVNQSPGRMFMTDREGTRRVYDNRRYFI